LNGVKNEGCRAEAKGESGPRIRQNIKATARHASLLSLMAYPDSNY